MTPRVLGIDLSASPRDLGGAIAVMERPRCPGRPPTLVKLAGCGKTEQSATILIVDEMCR
ncbi:hypothetical protein [Sphingomonas koreensis]|uniref:hypothetical protein n=1 Tax=Sphingomonas koreensis TaxID=93064 RepID=UPI000F7E114E|nr:hypothetical protein [Sphingomonas koreensis]MDC7808794.1 hypothetical protein [Sphingomonas koreensis]